MLAAMPLFWLLSMLAAAPQRRLVEAGFRRAAAKASSLGETVSQALTVKALGLEPEMERRFKEKLAEAAWTGFRASNLGGLIASSGQALQHLMALVIVYVGARAIIAGDMSIGALIAATILAARALAPMRQVVGAWQQLQTVRTAFARLDEMMNEPIELSGAAGAGAADQRPHPLRGRRATATATDGRAGARSASIWRSRPARCWAWSARPARARARSPSCCSGSTSPSSGRVLIDDLDVRLWSPAVLRQQIGVVPQEVQLFAGTIAENIGLGAADRSFERSSRRPSSSARTTSSSACRRATRASSASAAAACRPASAS